MAAKPKPPTKHERERAEEARREKARQRAARARARKRLDEERERHAQVMASHEVEQAPQETAPALGEQNTESVKGDAPSAGASVTEAPQIERAALVTALAGTWETIASMATAGIEGAPPLGEQRAHALGEMWASALEPYMEAVTAKWFPLVIATAGTAHVLAPWVREVKDARARAARFSEGAA